MVSSPHSDKRVLDEQALGIDRALHPNVSVRMPTCHDACGFLDALGLYRYPEPDAPATYLCRDLYHLAHLISSFELAYLNVGLYEQQNSSDLALLRTRGTKTNYSQRYSHHSCNRSRHSALSSVAPYCVLGGVRVVSEESVGCAAQVSLRRPDSRSGHVAPLRAAT
jgi:hypothetical protein